MFKILRRPFIFQSIGLKFWSNIVWTMPNKTIRPDFFLFVIVSKKKNQKCPNFFRMRMTQIKKNKNKKNLTYSFVLHLFGFDIKQTSWKSVHWLRLCVRLKFKNLRYIHRNVFVTEVLITRTSRLSSSVENVLAYFIDTEMFPEVLRLYSDEKMFFRFSRWSVFP